MSYLVDQRLIDQFAAVSGDRNSIHTDAEAASKTKFGSTIAHGALLIALFSGEIARKYPGVVVGEYGMRFLKPVKAGSLLTFHMTLEPLEYKPRRLSVEVRCGDDVMADGYTTLFFRH